MQKIVAELYCQSICNGISFLLALLLVNFTDNENPDLPKAEMIKTLDIEMNGWKINTSSSCWRE